MNVCIIMIKIYVCVYFNEIVIEIIKVFINFFEIDIKIKLSKEKIYKRKWNLCLYI